MIGYIYITTNLINGKQYIGKRQKKKFEPNYLGSGIHLKSAIVLYGKENFKVEILHKCAKNESLDDLEKHYIEKYDAVSNDNFYNIALGGSGVPLLYQTEKTKRKIGKANKGKKRTAEMNLHNSETKKGSKWMHKGTVQTMVMRDEIEHYLENGWKLGMYRKRGGYTHSEATRKKMSESAMGVSKPREQVEKQIQTLKSRKLHWYTNGTEDKLISEYDEVPEGFKRGRMPNESANQKNRETNLKRYAKKEKILIKNKT